VEARELAPAAFVIFDQNFAPSLPVMNTGRCLKIIRLEDNTLHELVITFLEATRGSTIPLFFVTKKNYSKSAVFIIGPF
jgi:hypothetical protein